MTYDSKDSKDRKNICSSDGCAMEQRSEKVKKIMGEMPRRLLWTGLGIMLAIIIMLISAVAFIPYPYSEGESILRHLIRF